jgi:hypothetical protein
LLYGEESRVADRGVQRIAENLRAGPVKEVIARLQRLRPKTPEVREKLPGLIAYYSEQAGRMRYDEYLRLGYGIGSGAVESAHKQVVQARFRQAGLRWSEAGARRLLALRLLWLNDQWGLLDHLRMVSVGLTSVGFLAKGLASQRKALALRERMRDAQGTAHRSARAIPGDLRARLEVARLDLLARFRALDRMDLTPQEIPPGRLRPTL